MDDRDVVVLVGLVRPEGSRWGLEAAIVTRLAQLRGGGWCWAAQAAEWTGADEVKCRRALRSLELRQIIKRDAGDSGRDHIRWCAVNENWRRWRVEWTIDPSQVAAQLALAAQQRDESPLTRIFARSFSARSAARIARSFDARSWVEDMEEVAGIARQSSARSGPVDNSDRAVLIARSLGRRRAVLERAILGGSSQEVSLLGGGDEKAAPDLGTARQEERVVDVATHKLKARVLAAAIPAPGRADKFLSGPPLARLLDLVDEHGHDRLEGALARIESGTLSPVRIVDALADLLVLGDEAPEPEPVDAAGRVSHLKRMIATHEEVGAEPPQSLVDELERWQDGAEVPEEVHA